MVSTGQSSGKAGAIAGATFALLLFLGVAWFNSLHGVSDQELMTGWTDGGLRRDSLISMYLMLLAAPCFLVFITQLKSRLRSSNADNWLVDLMYGAGLLFVAGLSVTAFTRALIAQEVRFRDEPLPGPDTLRFATSFSSNAFGLIAIPFAVLAVAAASIMILQTGAMPRWLGWLGLVVTALSLVPIVFLAGPLAIPLLLVWILGASVLLFRSGGLPLTGPEAATAAHVSPGLVYTSVPGPSSSSRG